MKKGRKRLASLILLLFAVALFLGGIGVLWMRPDWRFSLETALKREKEIAWTEASLGTDCTVWTLAGLKEQPTVVTAELLMLVNDSHPLPKSYVPMLAEYNGALMHPEMITSYIALCDEIERRTGLRMYTSADYRTREEQEAILAESKDGIAAALGCSEHEAGLALDVCVKGYGGASFLKTEAGREVNRICGEYGFIIRYPLGKEDVTGISYEPWHLRYVGAPHAALIMNSGIAFEEYLDAMRPEVWYQSGEYRILKTGWETVTLPNGWEVCYLSSDNAGHTVITLKMA